MYIGQVPLDKRKLTNQHNGKPQKKNYFAETQKTHSGALTSAEEKLTKVCKGRKKSSNELQ